MRNALLATFVAASLVGVARLEAQNITSQTIDTIIVEGNARIDDNLIIATTGISTGVLVSYLDIQLAVTRLYASGEFRDVEFLQGNVGGERALLVRVEEQPLLTAWGVQGVERLTGRAVRGRVKLTSGRAYSPSLAEQSRASIDSLYKQEGYYAAEIQILSQPAPDGRTTQVVFDIIEGRRVAISEIIVEGNERVSDAEVASAMSTGVEGFWWFKRGEYDEDKLEIDVRENIPSFYASRGFVDATVVRDTLIVNEDTGKGTLIVTVNEGPQYRVGSFEVVGNRQYSTESIEQFYPFQSQATGFFGLGGEHAGPPLFNQADWDEATQDLSNLYFNTGYIYARIDPIVTRRVDENGEGVVDLRWQIVEGAPAIVNRVNIVGNTVTHESVIRRAILMLPGDVFRQDALIRSYQNVSNLNFFAQPLPIPETTPANNQGDIDVTFRVEERNTGNVNFGASVGQGTGIGGFIGLQQPNLFGRGKNASIQWQFGRNVNDIQLSYTDPALRGGLMSGSVTLHNTRLRFTVGDLGRLRTRGGSVQIGFPLMGSRFTRGFLSYTLEESDLDDESSLTTRFNCFNCVLSSVGIQILRDTRIGLPFATAGAMHQFNLSQAGGPLGGSGNFRRFTFEGRWYAPLGQLGGGDATAPGPEFVLGYTTKMGFIWGDPGPHFRQLFSMGGTQFGIPLRGYEEFSITPQGFDPTARGSQASTVDAFGEAYIAMTGEIGVRLNQSVYFSTFMDAGNVWATPAQFNPTRLFRGAGLGLSLLTPLGPIGLDYAYGFDRVDLDGNLDPGWKFHFRLGQFF